MHKKFYLFLLILSFTMLPTPVLASAAQSMSLSNSSQTGLARQGDNKVIISFEELRYSEANLISPYDSASFFFNTPVNWHVVDGAELKLDFDVILSGSDSGDIGTNSGSLGSTMTVVFNNQLISNVQLDTTGSQSLRLKIPLSALANPRQDGRNVLQIYLNAQVSCSKDIRTLLVIKTTSTFEIPFEIATPNLDLSRLPAPFYLRNSLLPDSTILVVPDNPEAQELQAALNVMAGFGSLIGRDVNLYLTAVGQLTEQDFISSNLIFVGKPAQFEQLSDISFPLPVVDGKFVDLPEASVNDGIVELATSPWDFNRSIMLISGNNDAALTKAAQAVSSGDLKVYSDPTLVYVSDVQLSLNTESIFEEFTLQDLGYVTETLSGLGVSSVDYSFNASKLQAKATDAYLDLVYYHSGIVDYSQSSIAVYLNDQVISSIAFTEETANISTANIKIPPGLLRVGGNRLTVSAKLQPELSCDISGLSDPWLTIVDQSKIYLPVGEEDTTDRSYDLDFQFLPKPLLENSDLGDVAFVLPRSSPLNWNIAGQLSYYLGRNANPVISNLKVAYADDIPQSLRAGNSLILIGKASDLPFLQDINDMLPAPFNFADNTASEKNMQIIYRIPADVDVGYLELLQSPFNEEKIILVISGNSDTGLPMAGNTLLLGSLNAQLAGTFAVTNGIQVATAKGASLFSVVGTAVPESQPVVATPLALNPINSGNIHRPEWVLPVIGVSAFIVISLFVFAIRRAYLKRRSSLTVDDSEPPQSQDDS